MAAISDNIMITGVTVKGYFEENCYFYIDDQTKHGFLIDPGAQAEGLLRMIRKELPV
jgi:glyoxylase-like metal-dependent hydrolase (beta-lactamase superfamily II)